MPVRASRSVDGEQLARVEDDDGALRSGDDARRCRPRRARSPSGPGAVMVVLSTRMTSRTSSTRTPTRWSPRSTTMSRVSSRIGAVELEALAQVDHRHGAAFVRDDALPGTPAPWATGAGATCRRIRSTCRMSNANSWAPTRKVTSWMSSPCRSCGRGLREARAKRGQVEQRNQPSSVRATAAAHGSALPDGTGRPGSYSTDSASSTSRQSRRPPSSTSTPISVRSFGHGRALEQGAEMDQRQDAAANDRRRRAPPARATARETPSRDRGPRRPGERQPDHAGRPRAPAGARRRALIGSPSGPAPRPTRAAMRPIGRTWSTPPACTAALGMP